LEENEPSKSLHEIIESTNDDTIDLIDCEKESKLAMKRGQHVLNIQL
jgi:hypothetical protein